MTSPKVIFNAIFPVPVKVLNSYKVTQEESDTFRKSLGLDLRKVLLLKKRFVKQETGRKGTTGQKGDSMEESYEVLPVYTICSWTMFRMRSGAHSSARFLRSMGSRTDRFLISDVVPAR